MELRRRRFIFWGSLTGLLLLFLVFAFRPQAVPVDFAEVTRGRLTVTVDEEGETRVRDVFVLSAPVAGRVQRIEIEVGDEVVAGETVVAEIDPVDPTLLDARSETEAQAAVRAAEAEMEFASRELERQKQLGQRGVASARDLDSAQKAYRTARASLENARAALQARSVQRDRARKRGPADEYIGIPVVAPVSGRVLRVVRESAGVVQPGEPLLEIGDPRDLEIVVDLLSADAVRVEKGQEVLIEQWGGGDLLHGRVRRVEPYGFTKVSALGIEEQRVNVVIEFSDPPEKWQRLGHGYRVETRIVLWRGDDVVKVPLSALFRADGANGHSGSAGEGGRAEQVADWAVFVEEKGRARLRPVSRGHHNGLEVEVTSGLDAGARVVLHPSDRVVEGVGVEARQ
ncbi:MAG TPA: efflux RND transporter periplasmic adaptor subunit [Myxococcota bacterium]|nr:efflux RND transporter periplasmic adaptor subunit [Myxococcota bacterium]